jgi:predicted nucleotidyltransferase
VDSALDAAIAGVLASIPEVEVAYLFGSVARDQARADSDLDVGIVYPRTGTLGGSSSIHGRLAPVIATAIARATGRELVDVVDLAAQGPIFGLAVLIEGRCIYEGNRRRRIDFESDTISRAHDFRPTYDLATRGKVSALRRWLRRRYDLRSDPVQARRPEGEPR